MIEFCRDRRKVGRNINCIRTEIVKVKFVATKISMSQKTAQPVTRIREEKYVARKENSVEIEIAQELKKSCRDRVF